MRGSIWMKFGTLFGGLEANTNIRFGTNTIIFQGVISDFTHKTKLNSQAYRVNCFEEQARLRVPFGG